MRTRTKTNTSLVIAALLGAGAYACGGESPTNQGSDENDVITATAAAGKKDPLTPETRRDLYHISEGSEIFPYFAVRALRVRNGAGSASGRRPCWMSPG